MQNKKHSFRPLRFLGSPAGLLSVALSLLVVGLGSFFAVRAFAASYSDVSSHFDERDVDYVFIENSGTRTAQVYCVYTDHEETDLTGTGSGIYIENYTFKKDEESFDVTGYSSNTLTYTGGFSNQKTVYFFQSMEGYTWYVGTVDLSSAGNILVYDDREVSTIKESWKDYIDYDYEWGYTEGASNSFYLGREGDTPVGDEIDLNMTNLGIIDYMLGGISNASFHYVGKAEEQLYKYGNFNLTDSTATGVTLPFPEDAFGEAYIVTDSSNFTSTSDGGWGLIARYPIQTRSLSSLTGIPGATGSIMSSSMNVSGGTSTAYLPMDVTVTYDNSGYNDPGTSLLSENDVANGSTTTLYDNGASGEFRSNSLASASATLKVDEGQTPPQLYKGTKTNISEVSNDEWINSTGWVQTKGADPNTFGIGASVTTLDVLTAGNFTQSFSGGKIHFNVPVKSLFPEPENYTVTYSATDEKGAVIDLTAAEYGDTYAEQSHTAGDTVTVADKLAKDGYSFDGWKKDGTVVTSFTMPSDNVVLTGQFDKLFTLKFNTNGGSAIGDSPFTYLGLTAAEKTAEKRTFSVSDPTKDGYTFMGWSLDGSTVLAADEVALSAFTLNSTSKRFEATVTALWEKDYTLEYYDGDTQLDGTQTAAYSDSFGGIDITKDDLGSTAAKTFLGWADEKDAVAKQYSKGDTVPKAKFDTDRVAKVYAVWQNNTYTVTYHANGGTGNDYTTDPITGGGSHTVLANSNANLGYTRTGYTFTGWNTAANGSGTAYAANDTITNITANVDLYAQWEKNYTLEYYDGDTQLGGTQTAAYSDSFGGIAITKDDLDSTAAKTFLGWADEKDAAVKQYSKGDTVPKAKFDTTTHVAKVYAVWQNNAYTVTYHANGGTGNDYTTDAITGGGSHTVLADTDAKLGYARTGYTFTGWNTAANGSGTAYAANDTITNITANVDLYAQWEKNYTLEYYDGDTQLDGTQTAEYSDSFGGIAITKDDLGSTAAKTFLGWADEKDAVAKQYSKGDTVPKAKFDTTTHVAKVYAVWSDNAYTVTYHANGGTGENYSTDPIIGGGSHTVLANSNANLGYARTGYTFTGWNTAANGSGTAYAANDTITNITANVNLYAQWNEYIYQLLYDPGEASGAENLTMPANETDLTYDSGAEGKTVKNGKVLSDVTPTAKGKRFDHWEIDSTSYSEGDTVAFEKFNTDTRTVTAVAIWENWTYRVVYEKGEDHDSATNMPVPNPEEYLLGAFRTSPLPFISKTKPVDEGYTFTGWSVKMKDGTVSYTADDIDSGVTKSLIDTDFPEDTLTITATAQWQADTYTLEYYDGDTKLDGTQTAAYSDSFGGIAITKNDLSSTATKTFLGWADAKDATAKQYSKGDMVPKAKFDTTTHVAKVYAVWKDNTYIVTYHANGGTGADYTTDPIAYGGNHTVLAVTHTNLNYIRTGYTFTGWNTAANGSGTAYAPNTTITNTTANVDLYAQWEKDYTLEYYDGDTKLDGTQTAAYSDSFGGIAITKNDLSSTAAKTFLGWADEKNATSKQYSKGDTVPKAKFDTTIHVAKVYAVWSDKTYNLTYQHTAPEGTPSGIPDDVTGIAYNDVKDGEYKLDTGVPTLAGYDFMGWTLNVTDGLFNPGDEIPFENFDNTDRTAVAIPQWQKQSDTEPEGYTVTYISGLNDSYPGYDASCADPFKDENVTLDVDSKYTVLDNNVNDDSTPSFHPAYEFAGWKITASSGSASPRPNGAAPRSGSGTDGIIEAGDKITLSGNVTLKAVWKCNLTYDANEGGPDSAVPNNGDAIEQYVDDKVTVQDGSGLKNGELVFAYWSTTANDQSGSKHYNKNDTFTIKEDTTLYAIYKTVPESEGKEYTVTYDPNGGTGTTPIDSNKYQGGESVTVKDKGDLVMTNATFKEWNTKKDGSGTGYKGDGTDTFTMPESDVTLYAIWTDSDGKIIPSPGTGESDMPMMLALNMALLAVLAAGFVLMNQYNRRRETAN